ncbi:MAG: hypothetical protein AB8F95_03085, partial [Bacteroidia bacterium]
LGGQGLNAARALLGERIALVNHNNLKRLVKRLPVIARNYLENGISQNLWYEEVVPRETRFYFFMRKPKETPDKFIDKESLESSDFFNCILPFDSFVKSYASNHVQVGGNASVGYGLCSLQTLNA